ncbi:MAG: FecR family protein [Candidatus Omnitrophota bacterium]
MFFGKVRIFLILVIGLMLVLPVFAAEQTQGVKQIVMREGTVTSIKGVAMLKKKGNLNWEELKQGTMLSQGDRIKTSSGSELELSLDGKEQSALIKVRELSEIGFVTLAKDKLNDREKTLLELASGEILIKAKKLQKGSDFEVKTPTSIVGVRGTVFSVRVRSLK